MNREMAVQQTAHAIRRAARRGQETPEQRLRAQNEELQETVRQLKAVLYDDFYAPRAWGLTSSEAIVLNVLMARGVATKDAVHTALYSDRIDGGPRLKIVDVYICKMRRKLKPLGIEIVNAHGTGYMLPPQSKRLIKTLAREAQLGY